MWDLESSQLPDKLKWFRKHLVLLNYKLNSIVSLKSIPQNKNTYIGLRDLK